MLKGLTRRPVTRDLDVLRAEERVQEVMKRYPDMNMASSMWTCSLPYNFEDRIEQIDLPFSVLRVFAPSLEDLVVMKLYAGRAKDMEDITSQPVIDAICWETLDCLVNDPGEAQASALTERGWREMKATYDDYVKRCRP